MSSIGGRPLPCLHLHDPLHPHFRINIVACSAGGVEQRGHRRQGGGKKKREKGVEWGHAAQLIPAGAAEDGEGGGTRTRTGTRNVEKADAKVAITVVDFSF